MTEEDHIKESKKILAYLVKRIEEYDGGDKYITYGSLAKLTKYPEPYHGSHFGKRIGKTLGIMGHLFDDLSIPDWKGRIPYMQAIVVGQGNKLPSDGLREFNINYPDYSNEKKRDYVKHEYQNIFEFGERWNYVLEVLKIKPNSTTSYSRNKLLSGKKLFNPFGSEGSPEHRKLRDYIASHPEIVGFEVGTNGQTEYPLKSGDSIDVIFINENNILGVEVKSKRSGEDDLERGIFQCIKYREVLLAEDVVKNKSRSIDCILIHEADLSKKAIRVAKKLKVAAKQIKVN